MCCMHTVYVTIWSQFRVNVFRLVELGSLLLTVTMFKSRHKKAHSYMVGLSYPNKWKFPNCYCSRCRSADRSFLFFDASGAFRVPLFLVLSQTF